MFWDLILLTRKDCVINKRNLYENAVMAGILLKALSLATNKDVNATRATVESQARNYVTRRTDAEVDEFIRQVQEKKKWPQSHF